jgi:hypothetical protein
VSSRRSNSSPPGSRRSGTTATISLFVLNHAKPRSGLDDLDDLDRRGRVVRFDHRHGVLLG